MIIKT